mmetsp:Transcript_15001/g.36617  ORF Transcript_15001/g.36617 Transcript_15001/m.36617 type:complete len:218 (+) Transcript_15001:3626-4279(+)
MGSVMLEHVFHVIGRDEGVVDGNNVDHGVVLGGTHDKTSDTAESVDTNVDGLQALLSSLTVDNVGEFRLQRSSSDKESINVFLGRKSWSGGGVGGSTVKDTRLGGNIGSSDFSEVLTNVGVGILGLFWGGSKTSSNGPDWFVGDDNVVPVFLGEDIGVGLDLWENKLVGGSGFTALQRLSAACNDLQSFVQSVLGLGSNLSITLSLSTTFRVSDKGP